MMKILVKMEATTFQNQEPTTDSSSLQYSGCVVPGITFALEYGVKISCFSAKCLPRPVKQ